MTRLAVAIALTLVATPGLAAPVTLHTELVPLAALAPCQRDIDPGFVKYVAPPTDHGGPNQLLWLIGSQAQTAKAAPSSDARPLHLDLDRLVVLASKAACPGVEPVAGGR